MLQLKEHSFQLWMSSCQVPIGGYATNKENGEIEFTGLIMTPDGTKRYEHTEVGKNPVDLGEAVSRVFKRTGCL